MSETKTTRKQLPAYLILALIALEGAGIVVDNPATQQQLLNLNRQQ